MKTKTLLLSALIAAAFNTAYAKNEPKQPDTYAYTRGMECINEGKLEDAMDWMQKEVSDHPDNGYAYFIISTIYANNDQNGQALTAINNAIKKIPSKDKEWASSAMKVRADIYLAMEDTVKAFEDLAKGMKIQPENEALYQSRAQIYYEQQKYDLADADYRQMIKIDPGDTMGYMGIGRNANAQERWDDAIEQFDYVVKMSPDYSQAYAFRAEAYIGKKDWAKATDDIVKALDIDGDNKAFYLMQNLPEEAHTQMKTKLKIQKTKQPTNRFWPYALGKFAMSSKNLKEAIMYMEEGNALDANSVFLEDIARCYATLKDYDKALEYAQRAIYMDTEDYELIDLKADILSDMLRFDESLAERDKYIERYPGMGLAYLSRAEDLMAAGQFEKAIEDYNTAAVIVPAFEETIYLLMKRGDAKRLSGKEEEAAKDYNKMLELEKDSTLNGNSWVPFAYSGLGNREKALETMQYIVDNDTTEVSGILYNEACNYARLGMKEEAMQALKKAEENGYEDFAHLRKDYDLIPLHDMPEFQEMVGRLQEKFRSEENAPEEEEDAVYETVEVPFSKEGGVTKVKCSINDLPLHFVFDTGAADVTMSMVEANFMLKNDYIKPTDIVGSARYMDANGDITEGTVINLRKVDFGGLELDNVRASVVRNQKAPLLLGQSVLGRLGKIEIDNPGQKLVISHKIKK